MGSTPYDRHGTSYFATVTVAGIVDKRGCLEKQKFGVFLQPAREFTCQILLYRAHIVRTLHQRQAGQLLQDGNVPGHAHNSGGSTPEE